MEAVAAGNEVAGDLMALPVLGIADTWRMAIKVVEADILGFIDRRRANLVAMIHEVACDLRLTIDRHALATRQAEQIDPQTLAVEVEREALMDEAFPFDPCADPGLMLLFTAMLDSSDAAELRRLVG